MLLKLYVYGYLNAVQSSRRLEREAGRNVEVMWLTRVVSSPDHKTIADFPQGQWPCDPQSLRPVRRTVPPAGAAVGRKSVAIDGSKFKAVNNRDRNFTEPTR